MEARARVREKANAVQRAAAKARKGREKSNTARRVAVEAVAKIRASDDIQGVKRGRSEAEARDKAEDEIRERRRR